MRASHELPKNILNMLAQPLLWTPLARLGQLVLAGHSDMLSGTAA